MVAHRALRVHDILVDICEHLLPHQDSLDSAKQNRASLARAALVCRAFSEPALNVLWRRLDDCVPLLALFSSLRASTVPGIKRKSSYSFHAEKLVLCGDITSFEWTRFQTYARHVQAITNAGTRSIDKRVFRRLTRLSNGEPLVPALREFHGSIPLVIRKQTHYEINDTELISLASASLRRLYLKLRDTTGRTQPPFPIDDVPQTLLCRIRSRVPDLQDLHIDCQGIGSRLPISRTLSAASMQGLDKLRRINVSHCRSISTFALLQYLSTLANLIDLAVEIAAPEDGAVPVFSGFRTLRFVHVKGDLDGIAGLVSCMESPHLRAITIDQSHIDDIADAGESWYTIISLTASRFSSSLSKMTISTAFTWSGHTGLGGNRVVRSLISVIGPLLALNSIERLVFSWSIAQVELSLEDRDIATITESWPRLEQLELRFYLRSLPSIETLVYFASGCPSLETLVLPGLSADVIKSVDEFPTYSHCLRHIDLGVPARPGLVSQIIDRLFPNLHIDRSRQTGLYGWRRVASPLVSLQAKRMK